MNLPQISGSGILASNLPNVTAWFEYDVHNTWHFLYYNKGIDQSTKFDKTINIDHKTIAQFAKVHGLIDDGIFRPFLVDDKLAIYKTRSGKIKGYDPIHTDHPGYKNLYRAVYKTPRYTTYHLNEQIVV